MSPGPASFLVVGADSMVGKSLMRQLRRAGEAVTGTTRRLGEADETRLFLDLASDIEQWEGPSSVDVAIVCAGVTSVQACQKHPATSAKVNVEGISHLIERLVAQGAFVIYLSTNQVFDGAASHQLAHATRSPKTEYGRQKAEAERRIAQAGDSIAIVRFTKIFGPRNPLISGWIQDLQEGKEIHPFADMPLSPIPLACATTVLRAIAHLRLSGIFQVSGEIDVSYADAARLGAELLGFDGSQVRPVTAAKSQRYTDFLPAHTTLDLERLRSDLGIVPPPVRWTIQSAFAGPEALAGA
jgi:dTDP-4-dehydrorhamnose reductase